MTPPGAGRKREQQVQRPQVLLTPKPQSLPGPCWRSAGWREGWAVEGEQFYRGQVLRAVNSRVEPAWGVVGRTEQLGGACRDLREHADGSDQTDSEEVGKTQVLGLFRRGSREDADLLGVRGVGDGC